MMLGRFDRLRLCLQVELRSYVSEPELATFSGDTAPTSLGLVGSESRYQTLPGRGKATLSMEAFWEPPPLPTTAPQPSPSTLYSSVQHWTIAWAAAIRGRWALSFLPLAHILIFFLFSTSDFGNNDNSHYYKAWHRVVFSILYSLS